MGNILGPTILANKAPVVLPGEAGLGGGEGVEGRIVKKTSLPLTSMCNWPAMSQK